MGYEVFTNLDILAFKISDIFRESSSIVYGTRWHLFSANDTISNSNTVVVVTKRRGLVDDASPIIAGNVFIDNHAESPVFELNHTIC
jgi:hypothetical protein